MAVTIVEQSATDASGPGFFIPFSAPVAAGQTVVYAMMGIEVGAVDHQLRIGANDSPWDSFGRLGHAVGVDGPRIDVGIWMVHPRLCEGAEGLTILRPGQEGQVAVWFAVLEGVANVRADIDVAADGASGNGSMPYVAAWDPVDAGMAFAMMAWSFDDDPGCSVDPPTGWVMLAQSWVGSAFYQLVKLDVAGADSFPDQPADMSCVATSWACAQIQAYALGLRTSGCGVVARVGFVSEVGPGTVEPPAPQTPYLPAVNPLPPEPEAIIVPLPPWVPKPGPYRKRD